MKRVRKIFWVVAWLVAVQLSAARTLVPADSGSANEEAQIRAVLNAQVADWNRGDVDHFMQSYWKTGKTEFVGSNGIVRGWQAVLDRYHQVYPDRTAMGQLTFSDLEVTVLGPAAALVVGRYHLKRDRDQANGVFTLVFRKFPEGWKIINDHTSKTMP